MKRWGTIALVITFFALVACGGGGGGNSGDNTPDLLFFAGNDGSGGSENFELWAYDGINSPYKVAEINSGSNESLPMGFTPFNDKMYFSAVIDELDIGYS